jgi:hypothetical protein
MPTGYQLKDQSAIYFLTLQVVHWADVFTRQIYRDIILETRRLFIQQCKKLCRIGNINRNRYN